MIFEKLFYFVSISVGLVYYIVRYIKLSKKTALINVILQVVSITLLTLSYINNQTMNVNTQLLVFIFGIAIPVISYFIIKYDINLLETFQLFAGDILYLFKNYNSAIKYYKKVASKNRSYMAYKKIGNAYLKQNNLRDAFDNYAKTVELKKDDYKTYYKIGHIYYQLNKLEEAITVLNNTIRINPEYIKVSNLLAYILCEKKNYNDALKVYNDSLKYNNDNPEIYYNIAVIYTNQNQFSKAKEFYLKTIKYNKYLYDAYYGLGQICIKDRQYEDAEKYLLIAKNKEELYAKSFYAIAKVYSLMKEDGKVATALKLAIDKDSTLIDKALSDSTFSNIKDFIKGINIINTLGTDTEEYKNVTFKGFENAKQTENIYDKKFNIIDLDNLVFDEQVTIEEVLSNEVRKEPKKKSKKAHKNNKK